MLVDMRVFFVLVVDHTVHSEDNLEEKTREDTDIRIYHIS